MIQFAKKDNVLLIMDNSKESANLFISGLRKTMRIFANIFIQLLEFRTSHEEKILERYEHDDTSK